MHCIIHNNKGQNATVNRQLTFDQRNGTTLLAIVVKTFVHNVQIFFGFITQMADISIKTSQHIPGSDPTHPPPDPSTFTEIGNKLNY